MTKKLIALLCGIVLFFSSLGASAQSNGGQLCVRAFEDRDANGQRSATEPLLTRGLSANLLDVRGVVIASALLDQSPTAAQGVMCFLTLPSGQYSVVMTSADYAATTPITITTNVAASGTPTIVEFGGRVPVSTAQTATTNSSGFSLDRYTITRLLFSSLGALVTVALMTVLGVIVYLVMFGRRGQTPAVATSTETHPRI